MNYTLVRNIFDFNGTFGRFLDPDGNKLCLTCELPWKYNQPQVSCIPAGTYQVIPHNSPEHPNTWEITNVPGRTNILIHNGNTEMDSLGCVIVGDSIGTINGIPAVLNSVKTLEYLRTILPSNFTLTINGD